MKPKILFFDLEIMCIKAFGDSWRTMAANNGYLLSFGWGWEHEKKDHAKGIHEWKTDFMKDPWNDEKLVRFAHSICSEADGFIAHYGRKFDIPYIRTKFMEYGLDPQVMNKPSRDTCITARSQFKYDSNRLGALAENFGMEGKDKMVPLDWYKCVRGGDIGYRASKKMSKYCQQDVTVLRHVYEKMKHLFAKGGWPVFNVNKFGQVGSSQCPECGSWDTKRHGFRLVTAGKRIDYKCKGCGKRFQDRRLWKPEHEDEN